MEYDGLDLTRWRPASRGLAWQSLGWLLVAVRCVSPSSLQDCGVTGQRTKVRTCCEEQEQETTIEDW